MSDTEKVLSETKQETPAGTQDIRQPSAQGADAASAVQAVPESKPPAEPEDDNISWEDAFKEEEAANAAGKEEGLGANAAGNLDIDIDAIKEAAGNEEKSEGADIRADEAPAAVKTVKKPVKKLEFASFDESDKTAEPPKNLDFILDIPLTISVELGRTKMVINDMLQLGQGSVIELAKLAGEPLDIYVNGKLMARGEVVLVNDKFGVRLTDIISPVERVKKL
jgi:flagellar motor switch protein FliN/FliY